MIKLIHKLVAKAIQHYSFEGKELRRIKKIARYNIGTTKLFGFDFTFIDSASFIGQYFEIIKKQIYHFKIGNNRPYIIDCGANIGVSVLFFNKQFPDAQIIAFEPDKYVFSILEKNINIINNDNITLINKGLWNQEKKIDFINEGADGGAIYEGTNKSSDNLKIIEIETTSLREYLDRKVDLLKIDIEGAESIVIEDCGDLLENVERIFIEYHSTINKRQYLDSILKTLVERGFRYYIESSTLSNNSPFIMREVINNFDTLLNIFAYR